MFDAKKYYREYREKHKDYFNQKQKEYYSRTKEKWHLYNCEYTKTHREEARRRYSSNITERLTRSLRNRIWYTVKKGAKSKSTIELLGCTINQLKQHLEKQFKQGMAWSNYGKWHIDHIKPCFSFDLESPKEQAKCFNYKNLRPLWAKENLSRKRKVRNA